MLRLKVRKFLSKKLRKPWRGSQTRSSLRSTGLIPTTPVAVLTLSQVQLNLKRKKAMKVAMSPLSKELKIQSIEPSKPSANSILLSPIRRSRSGSVLNSSEPWHHQKRKPPEKEQPTPLFKAGRI